MRNQSIHLDRLASSGAISYHGRGAAQVQRFWISLAIIGGLVVVLTAAGLLMVRP